jgi:hypothetical protein
MNKVIFLDYGMFLHRSIYSWRNNKAIPPEFTCLNMIIASLRRVGIDSNDTVIVACDGRGNWRKDIDKNYKANRKEKKDSEIDIDWTEMYLRFDDLLNDINKGLDWHIIKIEKLEADDIMAVGCRYFKNKEVILVSFDADMEMLAVYPYVKIFSPLIKFKGGKGAYKIIKSPYKLLAKKIEKETADNLVNPILTEQDYENRKMIVDLLELPDFVENQCIEKFKSLPIKGQDLQWIPFQRTIRPKLEKLYEDKSKVITYEDVVKYNDKKLLRKKKRRKK